MALAIIRAWTTRRTTHVITFVYADHLLPRIELKVGDPGFGHTE